MKKNISKTIVFYAPLGRNIPQHLIGGGEMGCRRTLEILTGAGYEVMIIDKPIMGMGVLHYLKSAIVGYFKFTSALIKNKQSIAYIVGFYERNLYIEWLLQKTATLLKHKTVYEARNGRLVAAYADYGKIYARMMDSVLKKSTLVLCQGKEYVYYIKSKFNKDAVYTPNYVMDKYLVDYCERKMSPIKLTYFGRVTESKRVDLVIDVAKKMMQAGYDTELTIIGSYTEEYKAELDAYASKIGCPVDKVKFLGRQPFEIISGHLKESHFFIFPSEENKEGHSNSLTEAMAFGVVPIVSTAGFNRDIVGNNKLVMQFLSSEEFSDSIISIWSGETWHEFSKNAYKRVRENYTEKIISERITKILNKLILSEREW